MGSFNDLDDTTALVDGFRDMVILLVEGPSDEDFLKRMFRDIEAEIRFENVAGCAKMRAELASRRAKTPPGKEPLVFGLLDRDALKRELLWQEFFEVDDDAFFRMTRMDGLYVLARWELENYLLDPATIYDLYSTCQEHRPDEEALLDLLISEASCELHVSAGWCTAHANNIPECEHLKPEIDAQFLPERVRDWLAGIDPGLLAQHDQFVAKVMAFDPGAMVDKRQRFRAMLRMIDGKRFVKRLKKSPLGLREDSLLLRLLARLARGDGEAGDDLGRLIRELRSLG